MNGAAVGRRRGLKATEYLLILLFVILLVLPMATLFGNIDLQTLKEVYAGEAFAAAALRSVLISAAATLIALVLAFLFAYLVQRSGIPCKRVFSAVAILPMMIPSISIGMGLILLLGNNGLLSRLFGLGGSVYGPGGIVLGSVLYAFPVAYLMFSDILSYENCRSYDAAELLGIPKWRQFTSVTVPYLKKPFVSIAFATFSLIVTDYGVPLMVGGKFKTLPVLLYEEVIGQLRFDRGVAYALCLLIPPVLAFVIDNMVKRRSSASYVTHPYRNGGKRRASDTAAFLFCALVSLGILMLLASFVFLAFVKKYPSDLGVWLGNFVKTARLGGAKYLLNSLAIALAVAALGVCIGFCSAYFTARMPSKVSKVLHALILFAMMIPGLALGLAFLLTFKGSAVYGTLILMVMVNLVHFISSPYLMVYNSLSKINPYHEAVGLTLNIPRHRIVRSVLLPQCRASLIEMFSYLAVNCMMTISAVSFLANTATKPISLMINQFEAQTQFECAAVVSLLILLVNALIRYASAQLKRRGGRGTAGRTA